MKVRLWEYFGGRRPLINTSGDGLCQVDCGARNPLYVGRWYPEKSATLQGHRTASSGNQRCISQKEDKYETRTRLQKLHSTIQFHIISQTLHCLI